MEQCNRRLSVSALNTAEFEGLTNRCDMQNCNKEKHEIEDELYFNPNNQEPLKISCFKVHLYFWFQSEILRVLRGVFVGIAGLFFFIPCYCCRWCSPRVLRSRRPTGNRRFFCWSGLFTSKQVSQPQFLHVATIPLRSFPIDEIGGT